MEVDDDDEPKTTPIELTVHRLRNLKYLPGAVVSLAASSSHLAVARDNGLVELHGDSLRRTHYSIQCPDPVSSMVEYPIVDEEEEKEQEGLRKGKSVRTKFVGALCQMGCFGMIDFTTNAWSHHTASGGGEISDLCLLKGTDLIAVACQDGSIRLFSLRVDSEKSSTTAFDLVYTLPSAGAAIQSLACHRASGTDDLEGLEIYAGVADGTIRQYKKKKSSAGGGGSGGGSGGGHWHCSQRMTVECRGRSVPTQIWTLDTTIDGTLISGDSLGQVQFWREGVWLGSLEQNNNQADVLAVMAVGKDKAFASGVDARVVCLQRNADHQWVVAQAVRPHTHDVMAMALVDGQTTLVTAGVDNKLCSYRIAEWGRRRPVVTYPWPTRSPVSVGGRRVAMARNQQVDLYKLGDVQNDENFPQVQSSENQIGTIQVGQYVQHVCLGPNAEFLAVQTVYLRIFRIVESKKGAFKPQEIKSLDKHIQNVVTMRFLDNETLVVATASRKLMILKMPRNDSQELTILAEHTQQDELTTLPVHSIASFGSECVATLASEGTRHRAVSVYSIQSDEINLVWTLPDVGSKITALTFLPDGRLAVACEHFTFYLFDVATRSLATWSETAGLPMVMPSEVSTRRDYPVHIGVNPASPSVLFLASFGAIIAVDTALNVPTKCEVVPAKHVRLTKRRRQNDEETIDPDKEKSGTSCTMCLLYNGMLHLEFIDESEMVVVEQPWLDIVASFPDPLQRHVYGT